MDTLVTLTVVDLEGLLPEFQGFLGDLRFYIGLFLLIGPLVMLALGAGMFFRPAKDATGVGYRALFGRGSKEAWRYTQWLAGLVWGGLGALLTVMMIIVTIVLSGTPMQSAVEAAASWLIAEAVVALLAFIAVEVMVALRFDFKGRPRR